MTDQTPKHAKTWTPDQLRFMTWLALPKAERRPKTQTLLAKDFGIDGGTLSDWKRLPGFADEVARLAKEFMKDDVADVLVTIRRFAKKGSVPHLNMFLAMTGLADDVANAGKGPGDTNGARERLLDRLTRRLEQAQPGDPGGDSGGA